jgi:HTH-type transcriptional regulator/antitoxin HigA
MSRQKEHRFEPDYSVAPGRTLRARLKQISVSQSDLASRAGLSAKHVNQIMQGVAPITPETALVLERVTGTPAGVWNRLEADYREALLRARSQQLSAADRAWVRKFPVREMQRRGLLPGGREQSVFDALLSYFGVADRSAWERVWGRPAAALKQAKAFRSEPGAVAAWLRLGELHAREVEAAPYDARAFRRALERVRELTRAEDFSDELVAVCAGAGVAVVLVPEIGDCRVSGAAWWLNPERAVMQLTDRYKHEDNFWFAFFHEAGHLLLHSKKRMFIDDGGRSVELEVEDEANRFAAAALIPAAAAKRLPALQSDLDVELFAAEVGVSPGVVVGRLHNDGLWDWKRGNRLRRKLRIVESVPD